MVLLVEHRARMQETDSQDNAWSLICSFARRSFRKRKKYRGLDRRII
jgi:hypothetical protein